MYELRFDRDFDSEFHWNRRKKDNVNEIFKLMQHLYAFDEYKAETALVAGSKGDAAELIYDLNFYHAFRNTDEGFHVLEVGSAINFFDRGGGTKVVLVHNHPECTNFSSFDVYTFILCDCVCEMYLDSGDKVWYLRKHHDAYLDENAKENAKLTYDRILSEISKSRLKDFLAIDNEKGITNCEKRKRRDKLYSEIRGETFRKAREQGAIKARLYPIKKNIL